VGERATWLISHPRPQTPSPTLRILHPMNINTQKITRSTYLFNFSILIAIAQDVHASQYREPRTKNAHKISGTAHLFDFSLPSPTSASDVPTHAKTDFPGQFNSWGASRQRKMLGGPQYAETERSCSPVRREVVRWRGGCWNEGRAIQMIWE
jgi:hypothetical protein